MVKQEPKYFPKVVHKHQSKQIHKRRPKQKHKRPSKQRQKRHSKQFRCGRVTINKQNKIQKVPLNQGGGSRFCPWHYFHMNFRDTLKRLIGIFNINEFTNKVSLYDFQFNLIDEDQYSTSVGTYIKSNGLSCNATILNICAKEINQVEEKKAIRTQDTVPSSSFLINPKQEKKIPELMKLDIKHERVEVTQDCKKDIAIYTSSY